MNDTLKLLQNHRSVRRFKDYPISEETLKELILSGQSAASSNFVQAYTVIHVKDPEKRRIMADIAGGQKHVMEAPLFLVFVADLERTHLSCNLHEEAFMEGQTEAFIIATVDTALMAQNLMVAAESMGLGGVYIGALRNNPEVVSNLLDLPDHTYPLFGMCLGYPAEENEIKPRLPLGAVLKPDSYLSATEVPTLKDYDDITEAYYGRRTTANRSDNYTKQLSRMFSKPLRPHMKAYLATKKLNLT